jgi:hypothetical protein
LGVLGRVLNSNHDPRGYAWKFFSAEKITGAASKVIVTGTDFAAAPLLTAGPEAARTLEVAFGRYLSRCRADRRYPPEYNLWYWLWRFAAGVAVGARDIPSVVRPNWQISNPENGVEELWARADSLIGPTRALAHTDSVIGYVLDRMMSGCVILELPPQPGFAALMRSHSAGEFELLKGGVEARAKRVAVGSALVIKAPLDLVLVKTKRGEAWTNLEVKPEHYEVASIPEKTWTDYAELAIALAASINIITECLCNSFGSMPIPMNDWPADGPSMSRGNVTATPSFPFTPKRVQKQLNNLGQDRKFWS